MSCICKPNMANVGSGEPIGGNASTITLTVVARDKDGNILSEECKDGDLYLKNWGLALANLLRIAANTAYTDTMKGHDINGNTFDFLIGMCCDIAWNSNYPSGTWGNVGRFRLGSSTVAASIDDYDVKNYIMEAQPGAPVMTNAGNVIKLTITGTAAVATETTFAEVALKVPDPFASTSGNDFSHSGRYFCITRDTFEAVTVPAGGSLTVAFELWFNGMPS